jgi:hypothetical protein
MELIFVRMIRERKNLYSEAIILPRASLLDQQFTRVINERPTQQARLLVGQTNKVLQT